MRRSLLALALSAVGSAGCYDGLGCPYDPDGLRTTLSLAEYCGTRCPSYEATLADIRRRSLSGCDSAESGTCGAFRYTLLRYRDQTETYYFDSTGAMVAAVLTNSDGGAECPRVPRRTVGTPPGCVLTPAEQLCAG